MENDESEIFREPTNEEKTAILKWLEQYYTKITRKQLSRMIILSVLFAILLTEFFLTNNRVIFVFMLLFFTAFLATFIKICKYFKGFHLIHKDEVPILITDCTISSFEEPKLTTRNGMKMYTRNAYFKTKYAEFCNGPYPISNFFIDVGSPAVFATFDTDKLVINEALFTPFMLTESGLKINSMV